MAGDTDGAINVRWAGGERTFPPAEVVRIGRDHQMTVRLSNDHVSREHLELRHGPDGWSAVDTGSSLGTYHDGRRIERIALDGTITLRLGGASDGEAVTFEARPVPVASDAVTRGATWADPVAPTVLPAALPVRPGMGLQEPPPVLPAPGGPDGGGHAEGTVIADDVLQVGFGGQHRSVRPAQTVTLGRTEGDLLTTNPAVSRRHAVIRHDGVGWLLEDQGSSGGTFLDGRRVTNERLRGSTAFMLGDPDAGERLVTVAAGHRPETVARRVRRVNPAVLIGAVVAVVGLLAAGVIVAVTRGGGGDSHPTDAALRESTVRVVAPGLGSGSGTVLTKDGLILTNAHVADPSAAGQGLLYSETHTSPSELIIETSRGENDPTVPAYYASVKAVDGYYDLAVLRITRTYTGRAIKPGEDLGLKPVTIGDPDHLHVGERLFVMGFPGVNDSVAASYTQGVVESFSPDPRAGSDRGWITTDIQLKGGNSGGFAADQNGRLVGVPTQTQIDGDGSGADRADRIRNVALAGPLIKAAKEGTEYHSTAVTPLGADAKIEHVRPAAPGRREGTEIQAGAPCGRGGDNVAGAVSVQFDYSGFPAEHQDVEFDVVDTSGKGTIVGRYRTAADWPLRWGTQGCATVTIALNGNIDPSHDYVLLVSGGPNFDKDLIVKTDKDGNPVMGEDGKPLKVAWQLVDLVG